ncbi:MAG: PhoH family protein [Syntrophobacteraceae bacterium]|nr:PhoH family protein [Syntrophobacteraceae bacterium]
MRKTYVIDTNVLLHNPNAIFTFEDNNVVIPFAVIEEIDNQKKRQDEIGRNARVVSRELDTLRESNRLSEGVDLPGGGRLTIELNHSSTEEFPQGLDPGKYDNRILAVAYNLSLSGSDPVTLVTKDLNLRIKADVLGIRAEDFYNDKVDYDQFYSGVGEAYVSAQELDGFYKDGGLNHREYNASANQFMLLKSSENPSQSALARYFRGALLPLAHGEASCWGIKALNKEQKFAFELLLNDQIKVVTLVGRAGTGKTLLALAVGLEKVLEENAYSRLLITRPVIPMGGDLGFLPGTKEEKLRPWMQPIYDNLEFLFRNCPDPFDALQDLVRKGILDLEALTYIRGRSIPRQFIICDEAQNLSPHMIKTLITRVGEDTKIVLTGDPEQIDNPYLDVSSNGLTYLVERIKNEEISGHIVLTKGERSRVAEMGGKLL